MPSSRPNIIPTVIHLLRQLKPQSILDVGVGFGKWGHLFREYTDILEAEHDPARYRRENWRVRIDGIEGHAPYVTDMHRYLYDEIHIGDADEVIGKLSKYDLIFLGDIIEHLEKAKGKELLRKASAHAAKAVIVSTPKYATDQEGLCGNELERHRSVWSAKDFQELTRAIVKTIGGATLLAVLPQSGIGQLVCAPAMQLTRASNRRLRRAADDLVRLIPLEETSILVDEEQIRSSLPHRHLLPFLEREGCYWGPPPDDATAILELERLRKAGAVHIAFAWPCFWWLKHYGRFHHHLRDRYSCVVENDRLVVFDLQHGTSS